MEFLAPLMLLGAAGIAIPIAVHLIGRRRARRVRFAAVDFLLGSDEKLARKLRLRDLLLLLARVLVCLAIPLALAKPYASCTREGPIVERGPQAAVLVVDDSFVSGYELDGQLLIERARDRARSILDQLGPEAEVAVVFAAQGAEPPTELTREHMRVRDVIGAAEPRARPPDTTGALEQAGRLLDGSQHERRTVYLISPLTESGFRADRLPWTEESGPVLRIVDLAAGSTLDNLTVTGADVEPDPDSGSRGIRVTARVVNFGEAPVEDHPIALRVAGRVVARGAISMRPGEAKEKPFSATLPEGARTSEVVVELGGDALEADNSRYLLAERREEIPVLLVNGDPRTIRHDDELFYLEAALRPGDRDDSGAVLTEVTADDLAEVELESYDVVILANVHALPEDRVTALAAWVERGGGLFVAVGDRVDADRYNEVMHPLLPQKLRTALDVVYGKRGAERRGHALHLAKLEVDHPLFSVFTRDAPGLREAGFWKVMLLGPTTKVGERRVLARYDSGATALIEGRLGSGRLLLFTSSLDRDWNDLAIHPGYLPLAQQTIRYLARRQLRDLAREVLVGRSVTLPVGAEDRQLEIEGPGESRIVLEGERLEGSKKLRFTETQAPGFYRITATDEAGEARPRPEANFAVNVDTGGSDLSRIDPGELAPKKAKEQRSESRVHEHRVELWHAVAVALMLFLLIESILVLRGTAG